MAFGKGNTLESFDAKLAAAHMRGQWLSDALRDSGKGGGWTGDTWQPAPRGVPHIWKWADTEAFLDESCTAIPESKTARRSLIFTNPGLERSITHTMNAGIQVIEPGEIAWAHRHSISALRFVIEGPPGLMTVVDGVPCPMQPRDMVLTPNALWHDHKNESSGRALWLDVLDGPLVGALNQTTFQDFGECQQPVTNTPPPPSLHFPWTDMVDRLESLSDADTDDHDGIKLDYTHPESGGSVMATLGCGISKLPAGYAGAPHRHSSSNVYLVVEGTGRITVGDDVFDWGPRDCFVVPAWATHSLANASAGEAAILFTATDAPALEALGLHHQEPAPAAN